MYTIYISVYTSIKTAVRSIFSGRLTRSIERGHGPKGCANPTLSNPTPAVQLCKVYTLPNPTPNLTTTQPKPLPNPTPNPAQLYPTQYNKPLRIPAVQLFALPTQLNPICPTLDAPQNIATHTYILLENIRLLRDQILRLHS